MSNIDPILAEFSTVWNDIERYPTVQDVSEKVGQSYNGTKKKANKLKRRYEDGDNAVPYLIDRGSKRKTVLPETIYRHDPDITKEELLETLRNLYMSDPTRNLTRNIFRQETGLADSTWSKHFGVFQEFKVQAGIQLSRQQHAIERKIAVHVSRDHYRDYNDRHDLSDSYLKPSNSQIQTVLCCSDLHDEECDPFYLRVFIETARMLQPDIINFGGDIFDLAEFGNYRVDPRTFDVVGRIRFVHEKIFAPLREACPDAQFDFVEGNHEFRLLRHLADVSPALQILLSDLIGLTIPSLLGLDEFGINYISKADLAATNITDQKKQVGKNYKVYFDRYLVHHFPYASKWGLPGHNGHHHHHTCARKQDAIRGAYQWQQLGCGHRLGASYTEAEVNWDLGFNVAHINTVSGSVTNEYVNVTDVACVGGCYFVRNDDEMVGKFAT